MKNKVLLFTLLLSSILLVACSGLNGSNAIEIKGSDTIVQLVSNLAEAYDESNEDVYIAVTGGGSGTGIASLMNGEVQIADSSRPIKQKELDAAKELGIDIHEFIIARDMLSVVVHNDNPVTELTLDQVGKIYQGEITNWKDVGGNDEEITLYGRQSTSGTYVFFLEEVVRGEYASTMRNMEGNSAIVEAVQTDVSGVGYVGIGYITDDDGNPLTTMRIVNVKAGGEEGEGTYVSPFEEGYPISRPLFQYVALKPEEAYDIYNFLLFELSDEGQEIVRETGFVPITTEDTEHNFKVLEAIS